MYKLKPFYEMDGHIDTPKCMYSIKMINSDKNDNTAHMFRTEKNSEVGEIEFLAQLESRQEAILKRLEVLQSEVSNLSQTNNANIGSNQDESSKIRDIVISAHPANPPLSVFVLQQLLAKQYNLLASCHCHSSVKNVPENLKNIFGGRNDTANRGQYEMIFTLTWKDVKNGPTLMLSPKAQVLLEGETVVARFLARLLKPSYEDCDNVMATEIDQWVDSSAAFTKGNNKEKNSILKNLSYKLGKSKWLVGNEMSLADIMMWSVVVKSEVAPNVYAWFGRIKALPEIGTVLAKFGL